MLFNGMMACLLVFNSIELTSCETRMIENVNRERKTRGLNELVVDELVMEGTRSHCKWMAETRRMQHASNAYCENVAMGQRDAEECHRTWMNSSGHRACILAGGVTKIGVAGYQNASTGRIYYCLRVRK